MIKLTTLSMRVPNSQGIYTLSKLRQSKTISLDDFENYNARQVQVSFTPDSISNSPRMTAYGYGLDCWYLAEFA